MARVAWLWLLWLLQYWRVFIFYFFGMGTGVELQAG